MIFDRTKLELKSLGKRSHDIDLNRIQQLENKKCDNEVLRDVALHIVAAKKKGKRIVLMIGAHTVRSGVQLYLIDLLERGYISCIAMNGGCMIHDFEFALIGATTEKVTRYIKEGQFGLWKETGRINDIINLAYKQDGLGMGEAIGQAIQEGKFPYKDISLLAACYRLNILATIHVGIGYDIIHEHPNCDGAAMGALSYNDFLKLATMIKRLEGGVMMNFGSAVMAPEVFRKLLVWQGTLHIRKDWLLNILLL